MIRLENVSKAYPTRHGAHQALRSVDLTISPGQKLGILGRNGSGKSTLIRLISGADLPTSGTIVRAMSVSWPLAFGGAFQGALSGLDNLKFICRIYGEDYRAKLDYIEEFSELGKFLREPVKSYSAGMRSRLAFAISMAIEFDCFLIDEIVSVGDSRFHEKCRIELFEKRGDRAMVLVSHDANLVRQHCKQAAVLIDSHLFLPETLSDAFERYESSH